RGRLAGRGLAVDLAERPPMTAYEDDRIVYTALALRGTTVDSTPAGLHCVERRVANETMDSATLGIPRDSPRGYYLQDVLFTQDFTGDGAALHYNYWSTHFGSQGTHGCLGVNCDDALWFWNGASVGTPVNIHCRARLRGSSDTGCEPGAHTRYRGSVRTAEPLPRERVGAQLEVQDLAGRALAGLQVE